MNIFQIYHDKSLIPNFVEEHIKKLNPDYNYSFINFEQGKEIIKNDFKDETIKDKILYCLDNYPRYCHKSDLLRYCLLYIYGGVYIDVDLKPLLPFDEIIQDGVEFLTSFGRAGTPYLVNNTQVYPVTSNGILISKRNNPILLDLIKNAITNDKLLNKNPEYRGENVYYLYNYLNDKCVKNNIIFEPFKKINIDNQNIYMTNHILIPQRGLDCVVDKNKIIIHANDPNYSFKRQTSSFI
tara:strand:+ start:22235 stop:22951 length:717 start_codon:yes stop_codon:yes gene_type:complete